LVLLAACTGAPQATPVIETPTPQPVPTDTRQPGPEVTSKELNLLGWTEYVPEGLIKGFEAEFGVTVTYDAYSSNEEMLEMAEAKPGFYDVLQPSGYMVERLIVEDALLPLDQAQIPNFKNIDEFFRDADYDPGLKYSVPYQWGTNAIMVDTAVVTRPITSWADLWDPAFEGKVLLFDGEREVVGMALLTLGYDYNSTDPQELDEALEKLRELRPNIATFNSDSQSTDILEGKVWLGQAWNGEAALAHRENPAIEYVFPIEGAEIWTDSLVIAKDAPHQDAALAFLNYVLRPEVSVLITAEFPYSNPNRAAIELLAQDNPQLYQAYMTFNATNPSTAEITTAHRIKDVGEALALYDEIWAEVRAWLP
ncbi:MAG: spermidine/putrescine ABC transporter substrate-binding protein, partial [Candidatus Aminicenantales bacterium]